MQDVICKRFKAILVDIDGTIADCTHRRHYVENGKKKDWKLFFEAMSLDTPIPSVAWFLQLIKTSHIEDELEVIFVTGRNEQYRHETNQWLYDNLKYESVLLYMRKDGDFREDSIVKEEFYKLCIEPYYEVFLVLDDRSSVVNMWRRLGLACWQVAEGSF